MYEVYREVWDFAKADWQSICLKIETRDWNWLDLTCPNEGVTQFTDFLIDLCYQFIPRRRIEIVEEGHPWANDRVRSAVCFKHFCEGSFNYKHAMNRCSRIMKEEYFAYVQKIRSKLKQIRPSSTKFWKISKQLMNKLTSAELIPSIKRDDDTWARTSLEKATEFALSFQKKWSLPDTEEINNYSLPLLFDTRQSEYSLLRTRHARKTLATLREKSATGPDDIGTIFLRRCAHVLALPFCKLCRSIIKFGT